MFKNFIKKITDSQLWKSIFRHSYEDVSRNKILQVRSNVFLHLHPARLPKHALKIRFVWCMGGISFFLFLIELVTGLLLMFYYRPVVEYAYLDMKFLEFDVPFDLFLRNIHR